MRNRKNTRLATFALLAGLLSWMAPQHVSAQIDAWGLRTSIPAWFVLSPSIGADFSWNGHYLVAADFSYNHGSAPKDNGHAIHLSSIGAEFRYYLNDYGDDARKERKVSSKGTLYRGLYVGADARRLEFNYKLSEIGRDGWALTTGLLVGYSFTLPKNWGIDTSVGCGYIHTEYTRYEWYPDKKCNRYLNDRMRNSFGLTNFNVALRYRFKL